MATGVGDSWSPMFPARKQRTIRKRSLPEEGMHCGQVKVMTVLRTKSKGERRVTVG